MADRRYREQQTSIDHHRSADWHLWLGWLIMPDVMGNYWRIDPGDNLNYMGRRYAALC